MKYLRAVIYFLIFIGGSVLLIWFVSGLINKKLDNREAISGDSVQITQQVGNTSLSGEAAKVDLPTAQESAPSSLENLPTVTVITPALDQHSYLEVTGLVKAKNAVTLFPATAGAVRKINFQEGDKVRQGDVLIEIGGNNNTAHPVELQRQLAEQTLSNAQASLASLRQTSSDSLRLAGLQLQSAINQAAALAYDFGIIEQNRSALEEGRRLLENSLELARAKNSRDMGKGREDVDKLIFALNTAQDERSRTLAQLDSLGAAAGDSSTPTEQMVKLQAALAGQDKAIEELYKAIDLARYGLSTGRDGAAMGENQMLGQISQSRNQAEVLDLTLLSTQTKLGYNNGETDPLLLAKQSFESTKTQLSSAVDNATNQVKLAALNAEMARTQSSALQVKAPFDGVVTALDLYIGQSVSPQAAVAEIINPQTFELEVGVDAAVADRLAAGKSAQLMLAGKAIDVPIRSVGLKVDERSKQVKVRLALPNIFFKINQNLSARLPLTTVGATKSSFFIPLDAVIIGSDSQFVYIYEQGQAKKVAVTVGSVAGDQIEILSGLSPEAQVIVGGAKAITDGQTVNIKK